jgi:hypothetical protein
MVERLTALIDNPSRKPVQFALDLHDWSLENIFIDSTNHFRIVSHSFHLRQSAECSMTFNFRRASLTGSQSQLVHSGSVHIYPPSFKLVRSLHDTFATQ